MNIAELILPKSNFIFYTQDWNFRFSLISPAPGYILKSIANNRQMIVFIITNEYEIEYSRKNLQPHIAGERQC